MTAALVLAGFLASARGACVHHLAAATAAAGVTFPSDADGAGDQGCQGVCHQASAVECAAPLAVRGWAPEAELTFAERADLPPDAIPLGIDHPPQIA